MSQTLVQKAAEYYAGKLRAHGPTHRGVDWSSAESQMLRFSQLLEICEAEDRVELNDYGCGYGALLDMLAGDTRPCDYFGYDAAPEMIDAARSRHPQHAGSFSSDRSALRPRQYTVASGLLNVKLQASDSEWWEYVRIVLEDIAAVSTKGFAFNCLSSYSDPDRQRADLFYANPEQVFKYCIKTFARHVALLHHYRLYEFTVLVRL